MEHREERQQPQKKRELIREGTRIEMVGSFRGGGVEPISFRPFGRDESFRVLENLALQRVAKVITTSKRRQWQITAEVTEFQNANYLLLKRVYLKAKVSTTPRGANETPAP